MKKLLLIMIVFMGHASLFSEQTVAYKIKKAFVSKPACIIYGVCGGLVTGGGVVAILQQIKYHKMVQKLSQEKQSLRDSNRKSVQKLEDRSRHGEQIIQVIKKNENIQDVITKYLNEKMHLNVLYAQNLHYDTKSRELTFTEEFDTALYKKIQQAKQECDEQQMPLSTTDAYKEKETYSNIFKQLYLDLARYNFYLAMQDMAIWDIDFMKEDGMVVGLYINPPHE